MTNELKILKIDEDELERIINKKITIAKRIWGQKKREITQTDTITAKERDIFTGDQHLAKLVIQRENLEKEIIDYIDQKLIKFRRSNPEE